MMENNSEAVMPTTDWEGATRAELFVRSDLPTPASRCRQTTISRLEELVADGVLDDFSVTSWAKRVPLKAGADLGRRERDCFNTFSAWARTSGVRLAPFFDTRECYSSQTGAQQTQLVMPAICAALYDEDDELVGVVPHAHESGSVSVEECLERLRGTSDDEQSVSVMTAD